MIEHLAAAIGRVLCNACERQAQEIARRTKDRIAIRSDEYWLAMAALDHYPIDDEMPKSTSVVYRIHQLGHAWKAARAVEP